MGKKSSFDFRFVGFLLIQNSVQQANNSTLCIL